MACLQFSLERAKVVELARVVGEPLHELSNTHVFVGEKIGGAGSRKREWTPNIVWVSNDLRISPVALRRFASLPEWVLNEPAPRQRSRALEISDTVD